MSEELRIREYDSTDAERVWTVHERALRSSPLEFVEGAPADEDLKQINEAYIESDGEFLVGEKEGEIVAMGGFKSNDENTITIRRMRVHPDHQRQGYAERLLVALEDLARNQGFDEAILNTNEKLTAAQKLYENQGYKKVNKEHDPELGVTTLHYWKGL